MVEDRYVMIREDIKSMKGLVANLVSKQRSVPALLRGDVDDDKTFTKLSEIESKLTRALGDLDARVKKQNERLVPSLDTARTQAEEVAEGVEEAAEATRRVLKHNFRTEKPDEPLARLADLADDFLEKVKGDYAYKFTQFFQELRDVKGTDFTIADKVYDVVERDYTLAQVLGGNLPKENDVIKVVRTVEEFYADVLARYAAKNQFDEEEFAKEVARSGGNYKYYNKLKNEGEDLPDVEIPVEDLDYIRRGLLRMKVGADDRQKPAYQELVDAINKDVDSALNRYDLQKQGVTVKEFKGEPVKKGTAARFDELRKGYLNDVIARQDNKIGRLITKNRNYLDKLNVSPSEFRFLELDQALKSEAKGKEIFTELNKFFGGAMEEGEGIVVRQLNPETSFRLHTLNSRDGTDAVSDYQIGRELKDILTDMQKQAVGRLKIFRDVRAD